MEKIRDSSLKNTKKKQINKHSDFWSHSSPPLCPLQHVDILNKKEHEQKQNSADHRKAEEIYNKIVNLS